MSENGLGSDKCDDVVRVFRVGAKKKKRTPFASELGLKCQRRLNDMPRLYRSTYLRAMGGNDRRAAVKSFCLECVCWQREEVKLCTSTACPLYKYRPYK